jgi:hypothetical protein
MCGKLKDLFPFSGFSLGSHAVDKLPQFDPVKKPIKKAAKFAARGAGAGVAARSLFGDS